MNQSKQIAIEYVDTRSDFFCALADTIWENPELSLKEFGSTASYCAALRQLRQRPAGDRHSGGV